MPRFPFVKSTCSSGNGECVEVARNVPGAVAVRDSQDADGPMVRFGPDAWGRFTSHARCAGRGRAAAGFPRGAPGAAPSGRRLRISRAVPCAGRSAGRLRVARRPR
ncbi:DUF397 domain-containing protein [Streptomyces sp. NPDC003697]